MLPPCTLLVPPLALAAWLHYTLIWSAALGVSAALLMTLRTPWGRGRPLRACAMLSLVAHLLLLALAATIRFAALPAGPGDSPIRVTMLTELPEALRPAEAATAAVTETTASAPPLATTEPPSTVPPPTEPPTVPMAEPSELVAAPDPAADTLPAAAMPTIDEAPPLLAAEPAAPPTPPIETTPEAAAISLPEPTEPVAAAAAPEPAIAEPAPANPVATDPPPAPTEATAAAPSETPSAGPPDDITPALPRVEEAFGARMSPRRIEIAMAGGGSRETENAVERGLAWLASAQSPDGRWDADRWGAGREYEVLGENRGGVGGDADTGVSALALLAFLGSGQTHRSGPYAQNMADGVNFLLRAQSTDGSLAGDASLLARTYCHSMSTFALAEDWAMTGEPQLRQPVQQAVDYLVRTQNRQTGGWRYRPGDQGDLSQLGWIVMALRSAEQAGATVPAETWDGIGRFLDAVRRGQRGGLACYTPSRGASPSMTAEAWYCYGIVGHPRYRDSAALSEALAALDAAGPTTTTPNFYYWYYASLALYHLQHDHPAARSTWQNWNSRQQGALLQLQVAEGPVAGSWHPNTVWGGYGGRVYSTAMATMCLEVYYRFHTPPAESDPWIAARPDENLPR